ncbi:MAG: SprT family zinc-dependent metalloprotease [Chloroflexota bacterium]
MSTVEIHETTIDNKVIFYTLRRSYKAKYVRLEIRPQSGLTVVVPRSYRLAQLPGLLRKKERWILSKVEKYSQIEQISTKKEINSGDTLLYLGKEYQVETSQNQLKKETVSLGRQKIVVSVQDINTRLNPILEWWYRCQATEIMREKANELCNRLGVTFNRLTIRGARTRWGSCSQKGNLNFNWRLAMVPEAVIDYVVVHELAHLREMNHTEKFWKLVAEHCPHWRESRKWLKEHETELNAMLQ